MRDSKQRLQPLDRIKAPDVWQRARQLEPIGDLPEPPQPGLQRRVTAGVVAFGVFAAAVALVFGAFDDASRSPVVGDAPPPITDQFRITLEVAGDTPTAALEADGRTVRGIGWSYCWNSGNASTCVDVAAPDIDTDELVRVRSGQTVAIGGDAKSVTAQLLTYPMEMPGGGIVDELQVIDGAVTLPDSAGRFVLGVIGTWPEGSRMFFFGVDVVDNAASEPPDDTSAIQVTTPLPGADVTSPVTIAGTANVFEGTVSIRIFDRDGGLIAETFATATCGSGCRGDFSVDVPFTVRSTQPGEIRLFEESAEDGTHVNVVRIPVTLHPSD